MPAHLAPAKTRNNPPKVTSWPTRALDGVPDNAHLLTYDQLLGCLIGLAQEHRSLRWAHHQMITKYVSHEQILKNQARDLYQVTRTLRDDSSHFRLVGWLGTIKVTTNWLIY